MAYDKNNLISIEELEAVYARWKEVNRQRTAEQEKLNRMAEVCLREGRAFADDPEFLRQNDVVTHLIVEESRLEELIDDFGGDEEAPEDDGPEGSDE